MMMDGSTHLWNADQLQHDYTVSLYDSTLSGASVILSSQVHASAILVLPIVRN
jgi:hypothetical protein